MLNKAAIWLSRSRLIIVLKFLSKGPVGGYFSWVWLVQCINGDTVSKVIKIDYKTGRGTRGCFARMAVCRGLNRPLISKIFIKDNIQLIEC
ncbi:hypothetical protein CXB51_005969 [Gossypium anomalum]|uniref:Uncharacterized protein n=1 Tax=Gossypium anomalum TaxID=47600 RepID=A0A8J6DA70_9ROSI|nr:hypothetical protein CXB51_005969 [Gossypium anomalum]